MAKMQPFESFSDEYDAWFIKNSGVYELELEAIKSFIPSNGYGLEIGVGSGKFASPLGISMGIDPSMQMAKKAKRQGITVLNGVAEYLPFSGDTFDYTLMVTTICFLDDVLQALKEAFRVLRNKGCIVVAFVDKESVLGKQYLAKKESSKFYGIAEFFSVPEVIAYLSDAGFGNFEIKQTLFPGEAVQSIEDGFGKGAFVIIKGGKD